MLNLPYPVGTSSVTGYNNILLLMSMVARMCAKQSQQQALRKQQHLADGSLQIYNLRIH